MNRNPEERVLEHYAQKLATQHGVPYTKLNLLGRRGWPDDLFWVPGGAPFIVEFKRQGEVPRKLQKSVHGRLLELGYEVHVCDNKEEFRRLFFLRISQARTVEAPPVPAARRAVAGGPRGRGPVLRSWAGKDKHNP